MRGAGRGSVRQPSAAWTVVDWSARALALREPAIHDCAGSWPGRRRGKAAAEGSNTQRAVRAARTCS